MKELEPVQRALVVTPHPDDAEFGCAGTVAKLVREGKEVYLCWRMPEKEILFWHDLNSGFAGRKPL